MCDFVDGEVILAAPTGAEPANQFIDIMLENAPGLGLPRLGNLYSRLEEAGAAPGPVADTLRVELLGGLPGDESHLIARLNRAWAAYAVDHIPPAPAREDQMTVWIGRNHVLTSSWARCEAADSPLGALAEHRSPIDGPRIAVLDSGISERDGITLPNVDARHSFVGGASDDVSDGLGHGTTIAACIAAIAPNATIDVLKVISDDDVATEMDTIAALVSAPVHTADVVNLSLAFGLQDASCGRCGDRHHSSMSEVFQYVLERLAGNGAVVVAAAGNNKGVTPDPLSYPARFAGVVAVGALADDGSVLATSNLAMAPTEEHDKPTLVFAPGRAVLANSGGRTASSIWGTSVACAYVSAMLAVIRRLGSYDRAETIGALSAAATTWIGHDETKHGLGQVNWPDIAVQYNW